VVDGACQRRGPPYSVGIVERVGVEEACLARRRHVADLLHRGQSLRARQRHPVVDVLRLAFEPMVSLGTLI